MGALFDEARDVPELPGIDVDLENRVTLRLDRSLSEVDDLAVDGFEVLHHALLSVGPRLHLPQTKTGMAKTITPTYNVIIIYARCRSATGRWKHSLANAAIPLA